MQIQAVIFDRDWTLIHHAPEQLPQAQRRLSAVAPGLAVELLMGAWAHWPGPWPRTADEEPSFWEAFAAALIGEHALPVASGALAAELAAIYQTFSAAYPDAQPALAALRAAGLRLAVLSNFALPSIAAPLAHCGIDPAQFEVLCSSAAVGYAKPDPRAYRAVAAALGLPPTACCFVDDLAENVAGARLVGMRAYLINRASPGDPSGGAIGSLLDLIGLLPAHPARSGATAYSHTSYDSTP